jgi:S-adenosylmethionine:tRNA ribosyltransferase-isomerase
VDRRFTDLPGLLQPVTCWSSTTPGSSRRACTAKSPPAAAVELLVERVLPGHEVLAHLRASKSPRPGTWLRLADSFDAEVLGRCRARRLRCFTCASPADPLQLLEQHGHVPLPPYITHADTAEDAERYQTVFARGPAPWPRPRPALHFDEALLAALRERGVQRAAVTLHVGAGTFQPVRVENIAEHRMHSEWFEVGAATVAAIERHAAARRPCAGRRHHRTARTGIRRPRDGPAAGQYR